MTKCSTNDQTLTTITGIRRRRGTYAIITTGTPQDTRTGHDHLLQPVEQPVARELARTLLRMAQMEGNDARRCDEGKGVWTVYFTPFLKVTHLPALAVPVPAAELEVA